MEDLKQSWSRMLHANTDGHDAKKTVAAYDNYPEYEDDITRLGHLERAPAIVAKHAMKYMDEFGNNLTVLDVGTGTGFVGAALKQEGYKGKLYGIDGSSSMLAKAKEKNLYDGLFCEFIDKSTTYSIEQGLYDAMVSAAAFNAGYIHYDALPNMFKVMKKGAVCVVSVMTWDLHPKYKKEFQQNLEDMEQKGLIEILEIVPIDSYYIFNLDAGGDEDKTSATTATLFCFKTC